MLGFGSYRGVTCWLEKDVRWVETVGDGLRTELRDGDDNVISSRGWCLLV